MMGMKSKNEYLAGWRVGGSALLFGPATRTCLVGADECLPRWPPRCPYRHILRPGCCCCCADVVILDRQDKVAWRGVETASLGPTPREKHTLTALSGGRLFLFGGMQGGLGGVGGLCRGASENMTRGPVLALVQGGAGRQTGMLEGWLAGWPFRRSAAACLAGFPISPVDALQAPTGSRRLGTRGGWT